jgi:hypothetical protein
LNEALAEINGLPQEAHIGKTVAELLPGVGAEIMEAFRHVAMTKESIVAQEASDETPTVPGQQRYWSVNYYPIQQRFLARASGILASSRNYQTTLTPHFSQA